MRDIVIYIYIYYMSQMHTYLHNAPYIHNLCMNHVINYIVYASYKYFDIIYTSCTQHTNIKYAWYYVIYAS